jgi:hypothetical protein
MENDFGQTANQPANARCGTIGTQNTKMCEEPARDSLRDRVRSQVQQANRQAIRAGRLSELEYLLDKYPEVGRILELMDDVRL